MQPETQRSRQKAETRARLLQTALSLFEQKGFLAIRTQDVAKAAEVSHGTVFVHFASRDELIAEAINSFAGEADRETRQQLRSASLSLENVLRAHLRALQKHEKLFAHLVTESHALPPRARAVVLEINSAISSHLEEALERQSASRSSRSNARKKGLEPHFVFNLWIGIVHHHLVNRDLFAPRGSVLAKKGEELVQSFVQLLTH